MITKINNRDDLYPNYPDLAMDIVKARYKEWEHELEPLYPLMNGHRFFLIFQPAYSLLYDNVRIDEKPFAWAVLPKVDDRLTEEIFRSFCTTMGQFIARTRPGVGFGNFKDTPYENVKILELTPELFLTNFFTRCILGYFGRLPVNIAFDITVKNMPGKEYLGVIGEVVYDPETKNFVNTNRPYGELFNEQYEKCEIIYNSERFYRNNPMKKTTPKSAELQGFKEGTKVSHPKKGTGMVINITRERDGLRIKFDSLKSPVYIYGNKLKELTIDE